MRIHEKDIKTLYTSHSSNFNQLWLYDISIILEYSFTGYVWADECVQVWEEGKFFQAWTWPGKEMKQEVCLEPDRPIFSLKQRINIEDEAAK